MKNPIPRSALDHHIAFVGKTGSAKTGSTKSSIVEPALEAGERVCVIDPTGAWWGLRLDADGKSKGLPIYVFGGDHGDYPLLGTQGEMIAEAIGGSNTPAILDTTRLRTSERMRFFTDFADTILRTNKGPLRLVIDEAHLFAPQAGTRGSGAIPDMLHAANNLISLGRSRGLRIVLISQRPAKVHKDSLTQVETLVAMRLIAPQDRAAVAEWIADQADKETGKEIIASLPSLKNGEGWVWSPEANFLKRVVFPMPKTYDSSKVQGTGRAEKRLSPIDLEKLQEKFAKVKTEAEAKDPKILQKKVAELEAQLRKVKTPAAPASIDSGAIAAIEAQAYDRGKIEGYAQGVNYVAGEFDVFAHSTQPLRALVSGIEAAQRNVKSILDAATKRAAKKLGQPAVKGIAVDTPKREPATAPVTRHKPSPVPAGGDGTLTGPQTELLSSLAWWAAMGHDQPSKAQVAAVANWKVKGSHLRNRLAELSSKGFVTFPRSGLVKLTDEGTAIAPAPDTSQALIKRIEAMLTGPQREVFAVLLQHPEDTWSRKNLSDELKWEAAGFQKAGIVDQVMLSFTTDPYHPGDTSLTCFTLQTLALHGLGFCTLTKGGTRALRDIDLFRPGRDAFASTLTTLDDAFSLKWERNAALPADRISALMAFHRRGIFTWVSLEPTLDVESSLAIVEATHSFVDLYKVGKANYLGEYGKAIDWEMYTQRMIAKLTRLGKAHYIKRDLQKYLPAGYPNPLRVPQHHGERLAA